MMPTVNPIHDIALFLGGLIVGILLTASLSSPAVGRAVAKILSVILLGIGCGFLVWASVSHYRGEVLRPPFGSDLITEVGEAFGWGAGLFLGGALALFLAIRRGSPLKDRTERV